MAPDPPAKLPVAPNMSQILNRISLGLAKHERILQTLKRPAPPPPPSSSSSTSTQPTASRSGFSSLAAAADHSRPASTGSGPGAPRGGRRRDETEEEALFERDRALPPNAGVGFVEERKAGERAGVGREEKMLRARLLGKGGKGDAKGAVVKKRVVEEESEEEEGRSGLGKEKRRRRRRRVDGAVDGEEDGGGMGSSRGEGADGTGSDGVTNGAGETVSVVEVAATVREPLQRAGREDRPGSPGGDGQSNGGLQTTGDTETVDAAELAREKKRMRKQAKRKRSRVNKAQGTVDGVATTAEATPEEA